KLVQVRVGQLSSEHHHVRLWRLLGAPAADQHRHENLHVHRHHRQRRIGGRLLIAPVPAHRPAMTSARAWALAAAVLITTGCGSGNKVVPVSGTVTLDGKPLANAHVAFQPEAPKGSQNAGVGSYGVTDASGKYTLKMVDTDQPGA